MATYLDEWFGAQAAKKDGIIRRDKWSIDKHERMFENLLARCRAQGFHLIETSTQYVVLCNAGEVRA